MFPATKNPTRLVFLCPLPAAYQGAWCCSGAEFQKPGEQEAEVPGERDEAADQGSGKDHTEAQWITTTILLSDDCGPESSTCSWTALVMTHTLESSAVYGGT